MKKLNKKRIILLIILILLLIIQIKAFKRSRADDIIEITAIIQDKNKKIEENKYTLQATNEEKSGYCITLPNIINSKIINKYYITEKNIENVETQFENVIVEKMPGERIYLTQEEVQGQTLSLQVEYDSKILGNNIIYNQILENITENEAIEINGYMLNETKLIVNNKTQSEIQNIKGIQKYLDEKTIINSAYSLNVEPELLKNVEENNETNYIEISIEKEDIRTK